MNPTAIDPPGCGCTGCLTGEYVPLDRATPDQIEQMLMGGLDCHLDDGTEVTVTVAIRGATPIVETYQVTDFIRQRGRGPNKTWALPTEPPVGTIVRIESAGHTVFFKRIEGDAGFHTPPGYLDAPPGAICWAVGDSPERTTSSAWWTWGQVLERGPVTLVREGEDR